MLFGLQSNISGSGRSSSSISIKSYLPARASWIWSKLIRSFMSPAAPEAVPAEFFPVCAGPLPSAVPALPEFFPASADSVLSAAEAAVSAAVLPVFSPSAAASSFILQRERTWASRCRGTSLIRTDISASRRMSEAARCGSERQSFAWFSHSASSASYSSSLTQSKLPAFAFLVKTSAGFSIISSGFPSIMHSRISFQNRRDRVFSVIT